MDRGFSLAEVLIATTVMAVGAMAVAQLSVVSIQINRGAKTTSFTTVLATQKLEQLGALAWTFDVSGARIADTASDTTGSVPSVNGVGLTPSPPGSLWQNT